jgi:Predicted solute binding protein
MEVSQEKRYSTAREMQKALRRAFSDMQNAMSAKTIVISGGVETSTSDNLGAGEKIEPTAEPAEALAPDFGATLVYDHFPGVQSSAEPQAGIKTEVFLAGSEGFPSSPYPEEPVQYQSQPSEPEPPVAAEYDFGMTNDYRSEAGFEPDAANERQNEFSPNATVPIIAFDGNVEPSGSTGYEPSESSAQDQPEAFATMAASAAGFQQESEGDAQTPPPSVAPAKKKGGAGKIVAVLAGLLLLAVLGGGAIGGVWYYMTYYGGGAVVDSTPTPTPTPDERTPTPTATATPDASPSPTPTGTPFGTTVEPTPEPNDGPGPVGPRPTPIRTPTGPRPTPTRAPTPRPTPRRTPGVLQ